MLTDPISDMLTRIRNASMVDKEEVVFPFSKIKFAIAQILKEEGYILKVKKIDNKFVEIKIDLKYENDQSAIHKIERVSKPGRRVYAKADNLPVILNNYGIAIVSTPKGIMTNKEAKKFKLGGEIICKVY